MGTKIQHRRDNPTNWASNNPVLLEGEIAYNTTDKSFRIGDGTNTWSALSEYNYGSLYYMGLWDASSGSYPASPDQGQYYVVSVAGTTNSILYAIDDWIVYSGIAWQRINNSYLTVGTTAGTVCAGDDSRLSNARTPSAHNLVDTTGHPVTGLTTGHFLKATSATAYGFGAHGLTASDVGAEPTISTKNTAFNKNYGTTTTDVKINGTQAVGSVDAVARIDHVHPTDTGVVPRIGQLYRINKITNTGGTDQPIYIDPYGDYHGGTAASGDTYYFYMYKAASETKLVINYYNNTSYGIFSLYVNGSEDSTGYDFYASGEDMGTASITLSQPLVAGWNTITLVCTGKNASSSGYKLKSAGARLR